MFDLNALDKSLEIIRDVDDPYEAWGLFLEVIEKSMPSAELWRLPKPDFYRDIAAAGAWICEEFKRNLSTTGIYLGLNSLIDTGGKGCSASISLSENCDPLKDSIKWMGSWMPEGRGHVVQSLYEFYESHLRIVGKLYYAEYFVLLIYTGLVFSEAFERINWSQPLLIAWGLGDDIFLLGRMSEGSFTRLCFMPSEWFE